MFNEKFNTSMNWKKMTAYTKSYATESRSPIRSISTGPLPQILRFFVYGIIPMRRPATIIQPPAIKNERSHESVRSKIHPASGGPRRLPIP